MRPQGVELLAFEGEVAVIIGRTARGITPEQGLAHIGWYAPANDVGIYDLRWNDRGSNVLSKGHDGFTPIGPDALRYEATIQDPNVFTRSWQIAMPLYRRLEPNAQILEYPCIEFAEEFLYGHVRKQQLVKRWESETMSIDITRKVPPGDRFYEWYRR